MAQSVLERDIRIYDDASIRSCAPSHLCEKRDHMADIVLINPRFEISYWGLEHAMPFLGAKAVLPVASLPLLAALTPSGHSVTLIDENVEAIDFARCARADIVGLTGMNVQRPKSIASTFSSIRVTL